MEALGALAAAERDIRDQLLNHLLFSAVTPN
jgi:hypothetical protein